MKTSRDDMIEILTLYVQFHSTHTRIEELREARADRELIVLQTDSLFQLYELL